MTNKQVVDAVTDIKDTFLANQSITADKVEKILFILESDPKINTKGLVEKVNDNAIKLQELKDGDIQELNVFKSDINTKIKIGGAIGGGLVTILLTALKYIFKI